MALEESLLPSREEIQALEAFFAPRPNSDGILEFRVVPTKDKFAYYEPIRGEFVLTNISPNPIKINKKLDYKGFTSSIHVGFKTIEACGEPSVPDTGIIEFISYAPASKFPKLEDFITLASGESYHREFYLVEYCPGYELNEMPPGVQKVWAHYVNHRTLDGKFIVWSDGEINGKKGPKQIDIDAWEGHLYDECIVEVTSEGFRKGVPRYNLDEYYGFWERFFKKTQRIPANLLERIIKYVR